MEVLHDDPHEHVEDEEPHEEEEGDEVDQAPLVEVLAGLEKFVFSLGKFMGFEI